jgi:hypothetical protein
MDKALPFRGVQRARGAEALEGMLLQPVQELGLQVEGRSPIWSRNRWLLGVMEPPSESAELRAYLQSYFVWFRLSYAEVVMYSTARMPRMSKTRQVFAIAGLCINREAFARSLSDRASTALPLFAASAQSRW